MSNVKQQVFRTKSARRQWKTAKDDDVVQKIIRNNSLRRTIALTLMKLETSRTRVRAQYCTNNY